LAQTTGPIIRRVALTVNRSAVAALRRPAERAAEFAEKRTRATLHLLAAELAIAAYRHEHGTLPERLQDLVPTELAAVPDDPFSGRPLTYRMEPGGTYVLYSVGPDGKDDSGSPSAARRIPIGQVTSSSKGDFVLAKP